MSVTKRARLYEIAEFDDHRELDYLDTALFDMNLETIRSFRIPQTMERRPDLISFRFYGTFHLGWLLAYHNDFLDPINDFVSGIEIQIPSLDGYYRFYNREARRNR